MTSDTSNRRRNKRFVIKKRLAPKFKCAAKSVDVFTRPLRTSVDVFGPAAKRRRRLRLRWRRVRERRCAPGSPAPRAAAPRSGPPPSDLEQSGGRPRGAVRAAIDGEYDGGAATLPSCAYCESSRRPGHITHEHRNALAEHDATMQ